MGFTAWRDERRVALTGRRRRAANSAEICSLDADCGPASFPRGACHRRERSRKHPVGMPDASRWLSEATPPEPGSHSSIDPGRGRSPAHDISPGRRWQTPFVSFEFLVTIQPPAILPRCHGLSRKEHKDHKRDGCVRFSTSRPRLPTASSPVPPSKCKPSRSAPLCLSKNSLSHINLPRGWVRKHAKQVQRRNSEPGGAANGSQPIRSDTHRPSSAAGSRR